MTVNLVNICGNVIAHTRIITTGESTIEATKLTRKSVELMSLYLE
jgi:hypothetical protein